MKVFYTPPVPEPFKSFDVIDTRFVRYYAPQVYIISFFFMSSVFWNKNTVCCKASFSFSNILF